MNDERPIENLLRRYAKKRRADAPDPSGLKLHPATRRMLQGEVTRQFPRRTAAGGAEITTLAQMLIGWRARLIWAIPVLIVLGIGLWALIGSGGKADKEIHLAQGAPVPATPTAESSFRAAETPPAAVLSALEVGRADLPVGQDAPQRAATDSVGASVKSEVVGQQQDAAAPVLALMAKRASDEATHAVGDDKPRSLDGLPPATTGVAAAAPLRAERNPFAYPDQNRPASAPALNAAPPAPDGAVRFYRPESPRDSIRKSIGDVSQSFANVATVPAEPGSSTAVPPAAVLSNFRVEQAGHQLRVIDGDGSTYLGEVTVAAQQRATAAAEKKGAGDLVARRQPQREERQRRDATLPARQAASDQVAFRVEGTNRTLNQQVVFTGNFVAMTNGLAAAKVKAPAIAGQVLQYNLPAQQFPFLLNNSVINGRAQLGGAKEIEINAVPVSP